MNGNFIQSLTTLVLLCLVSCGRDSRTVAEQESESFAALISNSGMELPRDAVLLQHGDGNYGFNYDGHFEWILFSGEGFVLPSENDLELQVMSVAVESTVRALRERLEKKTEFDPIEAFATRWNHRDYTFKVRTLKCENGSYMLIRQQNNQGGR